jgi:hypothetical protein
MIHQLLTIFSISTPTTHFAHHALHEGDGIGHCSGHFGNLPPQPLLPRSMALRGAGLADSAVT